MATPANAPHTLQTIELLKANGWTDATEWCLMYEKKNSQGWLMLSAADWENDEFNLATVYVTQVDENGDCPVVLHNGAPLETALANLPA